MGVCCGAQARLALGQRARIAVRQEFMFAVAEWLKNGFFKKPMLDFLLVVNRDHISKMLRPSF